jgi:hypothetical protein
VADKHAIDGYINASRQHRSDSWHGVTPKQFANWRLQQRQIGRSASICGATH